MRRDQGAFQIITFSGGDTVGIVEVGRRHRSHLVLAASRSQTVLVVPSERHAPVEPLFTSPEIRERGCGHGQGCATLQIFLPSCWIAVQMRAMDAGDLTVE